ARQPGDLSGELVTLALSRLDGHREAARAGPHDVPFEPAQVVDVGYDAFADSRGDRSLKGHPAGGDITNLTRMLAAVRMQPAAEQADLHALKPTAFVGSYLHILWFRHGLVPPRADAQFAEAAS